MKRSYIISIRSAASLRLRSALGSPPRPSTPQLANSNNMWSQHFCLEPWCLSPLVSCCWMVSNVPSTGIPSFRGFDLRENRERTPRVSQTVKIMQSRRLRVPQQQHARFSPFQPTYFIQVLTLSAFCSHVPFPVFLGVKART